jgi:alpha-beta hydrolase superfamily lysophospholipase
VWIGVAIALAVVALAGGIWALTRDSSEPATVSSAKPSRATTLPSVVKSEPPVTVPPPTTPANAAPPAPAGPPYAVGVARFTFTDGGRGTAALGADPATPDRTLPVTLRYPATGAPGSESDGAPPADGKFPLVFFAHGFNISAGDYDDFTRDLAAQGFIVAAPDFPLSSTSPPGPVTQSDIDNQARDISFLISVLPNLIVPSAVRDHVATTEVGVVGHSDGGNTAARVASNSCCFDARIGAAVVLAGDEGTSGGTWAAPGSPPMLVLQGTADTINPWSLSQRLFDDSAAPKWLVAINGADHLTPFTTGPQRGAIVALVAEFLRARLQDPSRLSSAQDAANRDGLSLVASA